MTGALFGGPVGRGPAPGETSQTQVEGFRSRPTHFRFRHPLTARETLTVNPPDSTGVHRMTILTKTITAENTGTAWLDMSEVPSPYKMDLSIDIGSGTTVQLQRKRVGAADATARSVQSFAADFEGIAEGVGKWLWRIHCPTGSYGASTPVSIESA